MVLATLEYQETSDVIQWEIVDLYLKHMASHLGRVVQLLKLTQDNLFVSFT